MKKMRTVSLQSKFEESDDRGSAIPPKLDEMKSRLSFFDEFDRIVEDDAR
jgi:hypothetical protein